MTANTSLKDLAPQRVFDTGLLVAAWCYALPTFILRLPYSLVEVRTSMMRMGYPHMNQVLFVPKLKKTLCLVSVVFLNKHV